ncbi:DUF1206 domain-containing protein [bacterium]|nr:DUF1206 domain-containing protein [bacterium]
MTSTLNEGKRAAESAYQNAQPWVIRLARWGYAAKGVVYLIVGGLALASVLTTSGQTTGPTGALQEVASQPFGQVMLALIAIGLVGYSIWRMVQAIKDPDHEGSDAKGIAKRIGYAISGIVYAGLAVSAVGMIMGSGGGGSGGQAESLTARVMAQPFGRWLIAITGVIIIGVGIYQFYKGAAAKFIKVLKLREMSAGERTWAIRAGRVGLIARSVVYALIGGFLIQAAITADPQEAGGLGEALQTLAQQPYGPWLLGLVALGLMLYGVYSLVLARYRRIYATG